jgi:putative phosphoesterase
MIRIGLLSDTHGLLHPRLHEFFAECQEIWHAGDIGTKEVIEELRKIKPIKAVFGNIDGQDIRSEFPKETIFSCENVKVLMIHIGGYPGKYDKYARSLIIREKPALFISGHSHILKVMYDRDHQLLHVNPGAAGKYGLQKVITAVRFIIDGEKIKDLEVLEIEK